MYISIWINGKSQNISFKPPINDNSVKSGGGAFADKLAFFQKNMKQESSEKGSKSKPKNISSKESINDNKINSGSITYNDTSTLIQEEMNLVPSEKESKTKKTSSKPSTNDNSLKSGDSFASKKAFIQAMLERQNK